MSKNKILDEFPDFEKGYSTRKLMSDEELNPKCTCNGGYCYARDKDNSIVKPCDPKAVFKNKT